MPCTGSKTAIPYRLIETKLHASALKHLALVSVLRDEAIDLHVVLLSNTMAARLRLDVVLWVPVAVVDDDGIGRGKVDAHTTRARAQQKHKHVRLRLRESINRRLTIITANLARN
jgi:hypothetical protein